MKGLGTSSAATNDDNVTNGSNNHLARRLLSSCLANVRAIAMLHLQVKRCLLCVHVSHVLCVYVSHEFLIMFYRMPHHCCCQNPSTTDLDLTIANLFKLSDSLGACSPSSADGTGWIVASTELSVLSATTGPGATQHVSACSSEWGANVVSQVI